MVCGYNMGETGALALRYPYKRNANSSKLINQATILSSAKLMSGYQAITHNRSRVHINMITYKEASE